MDTLMCSTTSTNLLNDVRCLITTATPAATLSELTRLIGNRFECDACSIYRFDSVDDRLVLVGTAGLRRDCIGRLAMNVDEGLTGRVATGRTVVNVPNGASEQPQFKYFPEAGEEPYESFLGVPLLRSDGHLTGVLVVQTVEPREFDASEVHLLQRVANAVADLLRLCNGHVELAAKTDE